MEYASVFSANGYVNYYPDGSQSRFPTGLQEPEHATLDLPATNFTVGLLVTPAPVVFTDNDGTGQDTYTIPATGGVDYQNGGKTVQAGTYPGTGTITVTAKARTDYVLTGTTEWTTTFKATPYQATPAPVVFTDNDGTSQDTYTIPATDGVDYQNGGKTVQAGTYPGTGTTTVTAKARTDYVLTGTTEWTTTFTATPYQATPAPVVFTDNDGTGQDTYTIPATDGVDYQNGGKTVQAGTYPGTGTTTVTAKARTDYVLTGTTEWTTTFTATPYQATPAPVVFTDNDGTGQDTYTIPATDGVDYQNGGKTVQAGTYPATGTITVTAKARTDYVLTGTTEWTTTFKATPYQATPAPVVFTDNDGTSQDTYTIPATDGVDYQNGGKTVQAGTYPGTGTITVTAKARTDYVLTGTTEWTTTFKATPYQATPAPVVFTDNDGTGQDTYTIPATDGVDYQNNGSVVTAGTHPGTGTITVTAKARTDYVLTGTTEWTTTFTATPYQATPAPVVFTDNDGTGQDTYTIPATDGVDYQNGGKTVQAGTYPGTGTTTVTAKAKTDYVLTGTTEWTTTFTATPYQATPAPVVFTDNDGTGQDTYTIPATDGVDYQNGGKTVQAGTYPATGTITVTAKARTDYVLTGTTEWTTTFKATPYQATPAPVVFTDNDGTSQDTYTIPATDGVDYQNGGKTVQAGTYPGTGTITVTAKARTDYVLTGTTEWTTTFKATPYQATPAPVVFTDNDGTGQDTYTIPATDGVDYQNNGSVVTAGTHPGTGTITVTAKARTDYVLTGTTEWTTTFTATPYQATPAPVVFTDNDGTGQDTYTIPATDGVDYQINGSGVTAGTHPGTGTITVTAKAKTDYVLTGTTEWTTTFTSATWQMPSFVPAIVGDDVLTPDLDVLQLSESSLAAAADQRVRGLDAGSWYFVTLYSTPRQMGWFLSDGQGEIAVRLPSDLDAGSHRLVIQDINSSVIGWASFAVSPGTDSSNSGETDVPINPAAVPSKPPAEERLAATGSGSAALWTLIGLLLLTTGITARTTVLGRKRH
ncbi:hypothetical protein [Pseudarthrobacter siccitolerans]|uniref:hypothetical protein n=1 Tax=Pseudarthrobacter siccitolerans TaxID=861266 RepID=UPI0027BA275A|nr:hypothetical protein [Pseudarthrobacter siccitolerans]